MLQNNPPLDDDKKNLYMKLQASQLLAEHESNFHFSETTKDIIHHDSKDLYVTHKLPILFLNKIFNNIGNKQQKSDFDFTFLTLGGDRTKCVYWQKYY